MAKKVCNIGESLITIILLLAIFAVFAPVVAAITQTDGNTVASLQAWKERHQADDDRQFSEIASLSKQLTAITLDREARITKLETEYLATSAKLASVDDRLWVLILGVGAQLLNLFWGVLKRRMEAGR
jgi:hypothetical protein